MREIKFRAWNAKMKSYADPYIVSIDGLGNVEIGGAEVNFLKIEMYTGLKDSNGIEIFEGDVVKWDDASNGKYWRVAQVVFSEKCSFCFRIIPERCIGYKADSHDFNLGNFIYCPNVSDYGNVLEVIGNIHEKEV